MQQRIFNQNRILRYITTTCLNEQILPKSFAFNIGINGQFADKTLESSQKMLLGGLSGVRGHQAGAASVDEGHLIQNRIQTLFTSLFPKCAS